jgi:glutamate formiminotransferase
VIRPLVECVPNFSEGRDRAVIDSIAAAIASTPGAHLLDVHADADHHRSVVTLAGAPEAVAEAAVRGVQRAVAAIDLRRHSGVHPRMGAADVVPFAPVEGVSLEECAALARRVGHDIWRRCAVPVFFYEAAALRRECVALENIRRAAPKGGLAPDLGGPAHHATAGATAVGARRYLIAFNIVLDSADVTIARAIARSVRASSGGLPAVKAMGVALPSRNRVQVSMNLTDFETTPVAAAWREVVRLARLVGVGVLDSELVGLIPRAAVANLPPEVTVAPERILENRLSEAIAIE